MWSSSDKFGVGHEHTRLLLLLIALTTTAASRRRARGRCLIAADESGRTNGRADGRTCARTALIAFGRRARILPPVAAALTMMMMTTSTDRVVVIVVAKMTTRHHLNIRLLLKSTSSVFPQRSLCGDRSCTCLRPLDCRLVDSCVYAIDHRRRQLSPTTTTRAAAATSCHRCLLAVAFARTSFTRSRDAC